MGTILFSDIVFGPIKSRRLGSSLGVNLLPRHGKWCNFDCLYCECGFNKDGLLDKELPGKDLVLDALKAKITELAKDDTVVNSITFSGNGEPTMHPDFPEILEGTLLLRNKFMPSAKVSVLTNGSRLANQTVAKALFKADNPIIKIDSANEETISLLNRPGFKYSLPETVDLLNNFRHRFVLQTMFLRGEFQGNKIDNTTENEINLWQKLVLQIQPREIMIYTIDRETPAGNLEKVTIDEMEKIAAPLSATGYKITISG